MNDEDNIDDKDLLIKIIEQNNKAGILLGVASVILLISHKYLPETMKSRYDWFMRAVPEMIGGKSLPPFPED